MLHTSCFNRRIRTAAIFSTILCLALTSVPVFAEEEAETAKIPTVYRDGWKITVSGRPQATGTFTMIFAPYKGDPVKFSINVMAKQQPKKIREDIWKELSIAAGSNYKVKKNGDKIVTIKKANKNAAAISVRLGEQNLTGMSLMISKN